MNHGWEHKRLDDICIKGSSNLMQKNIDSNGLYPVYGAGDIVGYIDDYAQSNDYIGIIKDGSGVGRVNVYPKKSSLLGTLQYIIPNDGIDINYMAYALKSMNLSKYVSGAAIPHIYFRDYGKEKLPVPSLSVQKSIAGELDKINELIEAKRSQLADLDALAQSLFYEMFGDPIENPMGWDIDTLEGCVTSGCAISYGIVQPGDDCENGIPVVRPIDFLQGRKVSVKGLKKTSRSISDSYKRTKLHGDEILMCVRGSTGLVRLADASLDGANVTRGIVPLQIDDKYSTIYIFEYLKQEKAQSYISFYTRGTTLKQINIADLRKLPILIPPVSLQKCFADKIEAIEAQKQRIESSIADLETLLASRMDYWFNE